MTQSDDFKRNLTIEEIYALLPDNDSLQFELPGYDPEDPGYPQYYPLDTNTIYMLDLNFDGAEDLIYSGQSGWATLRDCSVYLKEGLQLKYETLLRGGLLDIHKTNDSIIVYTMWVPCCDSYTTRIEKYIFTKNEVATFEYSISVVGLRELQGLPDLNNLRSITVDQPVLYALPNDFRGTSPYFRETNNQAKDTLRKQFPLHMLSLEGKLKVEVLGMSTWRRQDWLLILTDELPDLSPSRYEWSDGENRRLVGWVKARR